MKLYWETCWKVSSVIAAAALTVHHPRHISTFETGGNVCAPLGQLLASEKKDHNNTTPD